MSKKPLLQDRPRVVGLIKRMVNDPKSSVFDVRFNRYKVDYHDGIRHTRPWKFEVIVYTRDKTIWPNVHKINTHLEVFPQGYYFEENVLGYLGWFYTSHNS
jgi:hypothetical protein